MHFQATRGNPLMTPFFHFKFCRLHRRPLKGPVLSFSVFLSALFLTSATAFSAPLSFLFASDLPARQKQTVLSDLNVLNQLQFSDQQGKASRVFGVPLNSENLKQWLSERSRYIVSETFNYSASVKVVTPNFIYPNADLLPYREVTPKQKNNDDSQKIVTVMTNMGAHIYVQGKKAKNLLSADIAGIGPVTITSPRTGIFKVGEGLFVPLIKEDSNDYVSFGNSLRRLAVYFHEARHSDGNGKSLGFLHAPCPASKGVLEGFYACDRNQNGPYTIEGSFLRSAVDSCRNCNRREKEALRNIYADKFNRVVTTGTVTGAAARLITDSASDTCKNLRALNVSASAAAACRSGSAAGTAGENSATTRVPETRPAWLDDRAERAQP